MEAKNIKYNLHDETKNGHSSIVKLKKERPNIDNLIKRILDERRKEQKKNFVIFTFILLVLGGSVAFSLSN